MDERTVGEPHQKNATDLHTKDVGNDNSKNAKQNSLWSRVKLVALGAAVLGMIAGSVVDRFVQGVLDKTGMFGPSLDQVVDAQKENFGAIKEKLAELTAGNTPEVQAKLVKELNSLLAKQEELTGKTHQELRGYSQEVASLRAESLKTKGVAKGADFYLTPGESITVGTRDNVFSLLNVRKDGRSYVNLSGNLKWLKTGDFMEAPVESGVYKIYNKGATSESSSKIGFDLVRPSD